MKNFAAAVLILFAASLIGGAFATGCMASPRAEAADMQMEAPSCCDLQAACMGGSCFAGVHKAGCKADHGSIAVAQKSQAAGDLAKAPVLAIVPVLSLLTIAHEDVPRPKSRIGDPACIAGYADIFARTGRLLI